MRTLLRNRDFAVLFLGQLCSMFAGSALVIVLAIWVKDLTDSNAAAGLTILAIVAPSVAGPFGAFLVDRVRRRSFLLWTHLAAAVAILPLLAVGPDGPLWLIYLVAFAYGTFALLHRAGLSGLLQVLLPREQLGEANSLLQSVRMAMRLVAPLAGAGVYAGFGGGAVAGMAAVLYVAAAVGLALLRVREERPVREAHGLLSEMAAGARFLRQERDLRLLVLCLGAALLLIGPVETAYFAVIEEGLGRPPSFMGVLLSIEGVGAVVGALSAPWAMRRLGEQGLVAVGMVLLAGATLTLTTGNLGLVVAGSVVFGFGLPWIMIGYSTLLQKRTPRELMGRVAMAAELVLGVPNTVSIAAGALLIAVVDYRILLLVAAVGLLAGGGFLARARTVAAPDPDAIPSPVTAPAPADTVTGMTVSAS
ncbi:MAG: MFS transporter [Geodermatophilaceae bacterium]|nr:MFS transporter [Geodermatophilaceae bacterium]